ncbi:unnamed protein product [Rotaria sp. Silwood2]|nr:unnamed protein product [Rotaria sp. Silwood2]
MSSSKTEECPICEENLQQKEDSITTSCGHKFHRQCAEKRLRETNKSDCRVCQRPSALQDALRINEDIIENECPICEENLQKNEDLLTTSCGHVFHRQCAEERLRETNKSDCRLCQEPFALLDALRLNLTKSQNADTFSYTKQDHQEHNVSCFIAA